MKSVTGVKAGESARAYVSQASYDSGGGLDRALLGNGRWEDWDYNERKQVVSIKLGSTQGAGDLLTLGFGYGTTNNNGNVSSQTIARPGFSATQTYTYDDYNRIKKVEEGNHFRDFKYKEPGNMYVPSSQGTGWAPGSFTPTSPSWFNAEPACEPATWHHVRCGRQPDGDRGLRVRLRRRKPPRVEHAEQRDDELRL